MVMTDSFGSVLLHCIFSRGQGSLVGPLTHQLCRWNLRPNITPEYNIRRGYSSPASCACSVVIRYFRRNVSNPFFQSVPSTDAVIMGFPIVPLIHTTIAFASAIYAWRYLAVVNIMGGEEFFHFLWYQVWTIIRVNLLRKAICSKDLHETADSNIRGSDKFKFWPARTGIDEN